ncbi:MAG: hypothetical protein KJ634_08730 [Gammaproteobacteria bacterium]|nr:hypothetical protein [Gammaproteobacteria bacterium]MBU1415690.1 hypothetical protein [Gammaproteobacteria bacterium]
MSPRLTFPALLALLLSGTAAAVEIHAAISVAPEYRARNDASSYLTDATAAEIATRSSRQDIELRLQQGGLNAQGTLRQQVANGSSPEYHGVANQFYYDGRIADGLGWTVGKKVLSWGVGFGFKPLDVVQREDRRSVNAPPLVGVPLLALERFTGSDAWTIAWTRPGQGDGDINNDGGERDSALALHWYRLAGDNDVHGVLRVSPRRRLEAGFGATRILGDEWAIHGAALYQRRGWRRTNALLDDGGALAATDPMMYAAHGGGVKSVAGVQWTGESGISLLAEAWYDADAYREGDWRALDALTAQQLALRGVAPAAAIDGNIAWSSQAFLASNLLRKNVLLRLAYDDRDGFKPYGELLVTPGDGGRVLTLGAVWEGDRQRYTLGARQVGGAADSAYAQAPIKRVIWAEWRLAVF